MYIDAKNMSFMQLNDAVRAANEDVEIVNCLGQRFIGSGLRDIKITINGVPGNALGAYLDGAEINVLGNAQDSTGDTMNEGRIIIHGDVGDAAGYAMRGGKIFVRGNAGYRAGIHMKQYKDKKPVMVIGGVCGSFLGEYQAGGVIVVLNIDKENRPVGYFCGTGMHGGKIFIRGDISNIKLPSQVNAQEASETDMLEVSCYVKEYCSLFNKNADSILAERFYILTPNTKNPYKQMYVQN